MGVGIYIKGKPQRRLFTRPSSRQMLRNIERFSVSQVNDVQRKFIRTSLEGQELSVVLNPAEEPASFSAEDDDTIVFSAKTSTAGPGYHHFLVNLVEECGETVGISWAWDDPSEDIGDETGYQQHRDYEKLQIVLTA